MYSEIQKCNNSKLISKNLVIQIFLSKSCFLCKIVVIFYNKNKIKKEKIMEVELKENERIDDLEFKNLKIIQNTQGFCFGIDAVLLSDFSKNIKNNAKVLDLGTGTGIISILLCGKTNLSKIIGVEVQEEVADMAKRSAKLNNLEDKFEILNDNIINLDKLYGRNSFDAIVTNPPYKKENTGILNDEEKKIISRHEVLAKLEDYIKISNKLLKDKGEFYMVHRPERLVDILSYMRQYKIEPKEIRFVCSHNGESPKLVLVKGVKNAKPFLKFRENLYIYDNEGEYTEEIYKIYNKNHVKNLGNDSNICEKQ